MITTLTTFQLPQPITPEEAKKMFLSTAPKYQDVPGLVRKCYILSEDGKTAGGVYLWKTRADAQALYTESWFAFVKSKYGTDASVTYFDSPVVVDNVTHRIITDD
jgi:hypothetical protein